MLTPVADPAPDVPVTTKQLARGYVARGAALTEANGKIEAIAEIVDGEGV
ncbi:hypothetical protein [Tropicimonas marinistellae]|nr:hypothetical protein [Tropicimonas marinistellae]